MSHIRSQSRHVRAMPTVSGSSPSYTGPLDLVPGAGWKFAYSTARALSADMLGENGYTIKRLGGGDPTQTFAYNASTGAIDSAAITTFLSGDGGAFDLLNDHTASGVDLDASDNALWSASVLNSKPGLVASADAPVELSNLVQTLNFTGGVATLFFVSTHGLTVRTINDDYIDAGSGDSMNGPYCDMYEDATGDEAGGQADPSAAGYKLYVFRWKFGSKLLRINGVSTPFTTDFDSGDALGNLTTDDTRLTLAAEANGFTEVMLANSEMSDADILSVSQDIATFYNITLS